MKCCLWICSLLAVLALPLAGCNGKVVGGGGDGGGGSGGGTTTSATGSGGSGGAAGDACQHYADTIIAKYTECGVDIGTSPGGSGSTTCTPELQVTAACYEACVPLLDCPCLVDSSGPDCGSKMQPYVDCLTACQ